MKNPQSPSLSWLRNQERLKDIHDTQTGVPLGIPRGARCVQRFDDSLNSAIHITYRISLRSSSMREPRDPLLKVVYLYIYPTHSKHIQEIVINDIEAGERYKEKLALSQKKMQQQSQLECKFNKGDHPRIYKMCTSWRNDKDETSVHNTPWGASNSLFKFIR